MRIGIFASSNISAYASVLALKLSEQAQSLCIICAQKSKAATLLSHAKKNGYLATVKKILQHYNLAQSSEKDSRYYLKEYASANKLDGWGLSLSDISAKKGFEYLKVNCIESKEVIDYIKQKKIDILINAGDVIFKQAAIDAPRIGILNAHMGFLPAFRGMNVLEWSLLYGRQIGVTLHFIDRGIDTGDIVLFREIPIEEGDTIATLRAKSTVLNVELISEAIPLLEQGKIQRVKQLPQEGKQYFLMHPRLKEISEKKIQHFLEAINSDKIKSTELI